MNNNKQTKKRQNKARGSKGQKQPANKLSRSSQGAKAFTVTVPQAYGSYMPPSSFTTTTIGNGVIRVRGHELLGTVVQSTINNNLSGVFDLNPACWNTSRLALLARTYEKYRYERFKITYYPSNPTTMPGNVAVYLELEAFENMTDSVVVALNHQYSGMSSIWQSCGFTYVRPNQDPTTYIMTAKAGTDLALFSQGRVGVVRASTSSDGLSGFLAIEYDVTFMYPELELGYPGTQFETSSASLGAAVNGIISAAPAWSSLNVKLAEIVLAKPLQDVYIGGNTNMYSLPAGQTLFTAWDGTRWGLYLTVQAALAATGALFSAVVSSTFPLQYYVRKMLA